MRYVSTFVALMAAGCLTPRTYEPTVRYRLDPAPEVAAVEPGNATLGVRPLQPGRSYTAKICFLEPGHELGRYERAEWAELPRDVITQALTDALVATGRFRDVGLASDLARPDYILTGYLRRFEEDRTRDPWEAVCEVRLEMRKAMAPGEVWAATLTKRRPLAERTLPALASAMNEAIAELVEEAATAIAQH